MRILKSSEQVFDIFDEDLVAFISIFAIKHY